MDGFMPPCVNQRIADSLAVQLFVSAVLRRSFSTTTWNFKE